MSYAETMDLPIRTFWFMNDCVERIQSAEDKRSFRVANNAQGGEHAQEYFESLDESVGKIYVVDETVKALSAKLDVDGLNELRAMVG